jgi:succinyl-CoA synthetase beta subunit
MGFALGLNAKQVGQLSKIMLGLYKLFNEKDLALVELNPLAILTDGNLLCSTARSIPTTTPTSAIPSWWRCATSSRKTRPKCWPAKYDLNYVSLDGNIGCMVNGAGLAMATMDVIKLYGGAPANFLDVGGGATSERSPNAFKLILRTRT